MTLSLDIIYEWIEQEVIPKQISYNEWKPCNQAVNMFISAPEFGFLCASMLADILWGTAVFGN